tara:strand:- start:527 stop:742 length:216 start_codon:yes stop_codon:yes gene_type:complete
MESNTKKNYWDQKPMWCKPWSIISFGIFVLSLSWMLLNNIIITSILGFFIIVWWVIFLIFAPSSYQELPDK